jgi:hypothetical protein
MREGKMGRDGEKKMIREKVYKIENKIRNMEYKNDKLKE